jgi:hypothetical protein
LAITGQKPLAIDSLEIRLQSRRELCNAATNIEDTGRVNGTKFSEDRIPRRSADKRLDESCVMEACDPVEERHRRRRRR